MTIIPDTMYAVQASISEKQGEWNVTRDLPTFYLMAATQGIVSEEHAEKVARDLLTDTLPRGTDAVEFHLSVVNLGRVAFFA